MQLNLSSTTGDVSCPTINSSYTKGAVSFSAEQKHTNIKTVKIRFCYQKNDSESGFYVEIFEINLSNFILYVFFSRDLALWRTPVRLREPNHDFCI